MMASLDPEQPIPSRIALGSPGGAAGWSLNVADCSLSVHGASAASSYFSANSWTRHFDPLDFDHGGDVVETEGTGRVQADDVELVTDLAVQKSTDLIDTAEPIAALPELQGAGKVRDLREASALSPALQDILTRYSAADSRGRNWSCWMNCWSNGPIPPAWLDLWLSALLRSIGSNIRLLAIFEELPI